MMNINRKKLTPAMSNKETLQKRVVTKTSPRYGERILSFLVDVCVMLAPVMIWNIIIIAILGNIVGISGALFVNMIVGILILFSIFFINAYIYTLTKGRSMGMGMYGFRVITNSGKVPKKAKLITREIVGFSIPFLVLLYFFSIFGVVGYWALNGIVILLNRQHKSIIDFIIGTKVVTDNKKVNETVVVTKKEPVVEKVRGNIVKYQPKIDLHIHSNFSANGQYNVEEIFQKAKANGLETISITDINCAKANAIALKMSELYGVKYIPGIEINCELGGRRVRILGYFIQYHNELFSQIENDSLVNEKRASIDRVRKFEKLIGEPIDINRLFEKNRFQRIPGEMIANHVLNRPEYKHVALLQPYITGSKRDNANMQLAKDYFAYGKPCYVPVKYPLLQDVLDVIELSGGISVIAHPGKVLTLNASILNEVIRSGIQGIEIFHPMHTTREMSDLLKIATERKLFITSGSDFYNDRKRNAIGNTNCPKEAEALVELFMKAKQ